MLSFHNGKFDHFGLTGASVFVIIFTAEVCMSRARRCSDWFFQKQDVMPGRGDSHIKRGMVVISLVSVRVRYCSGLCEMKWRKLKKDKKKIASNDNVFITVRTDENCHFHNSF